MTVWGEVSFKVKRATTFMERFTIGQLADMTGLEYQSVETVVQRLLKDGYITQVKPRQPEGRKRVGRPCQTYALVNDPVMVKKLYSSIEAFQIEEALTAAPDRKPGSAHFDAAVSIIDSLEAGEKEISAALLDEAAERLDFARRYEEMIEEGIEVAYAYVDFQQARLEFLRGNRAESEKLLAQARSVFEDFDLKDQLRLLDEYVLAITLKKQLETLLQDTQGTLGSLAEQFKEVVRPLAHLTVSPALSNIIFKVGEVVDTANQAKAKLIEENKALRMRIDQLMARPIKLGQKPRYESRVQMANVLSVPKQDISIHIKTSPLIRGLDVIASGLGLLLLSPVFLIIGVMIELTSAGPVFYKEKRVGQGGRLFKLYKFRSMYSDADQQGPGITVKDDPRVTPVGRFLRRTKLDELPQLINVFRGEMSLVGPRPEDPRYVALYSPRQRQVLAAQPGMTSPASLHYQDEETLLSGDNWETVYQQQVLPSKLALDLAYLQQRTLWTDLALILQTIAVLINVKKPISSILNLRNRHFFMLDILAWLFTPALALTLYLDRLDWWPRIGQALIFFTLVALLVKLPTFYKLNLYKRYWHYAGVSDLTLVLIATGLSTTILTALFVGAQATLERYDLAMYRCVPLIDGLLTCLTVGGFRFGLRWLYHWCYQRQHVVGGWRVLVVGAGEAGTMVVREMRVNPQLGMEPVAFVDDDPAKVGTHIHSLPVLGTYAQIPELVDRYRIQRIIVAIPSAPLAKLREIIAKCEKTGVATHNLPRIYELLAGHKTISPLTQVDINRLLRREPVEIDQTEVATYLAGSTVLVTGAGGSIGSELCRQIARFDPAQVILLGHGENSIFEIGLDLRLSFPDLVTHQVIVDVRDRQRVNWVIEKYRPDVIFHAAAQKHLSFTEANVEEAITNNVLGTQNVLRAAEQYGVERFVFISTDKAVNPTSIMGATKRLAELLVMAVARQSGRAYMVVRFGNVLGSRGSVISIFQRQIAAGGPLTITHPDMRRYFMTIPEAVQLVLQASELGRGGEIFVLDMGQPVRILDLAIDLIKLSGLEPGRDIKIVYTGIRPGEKLNEELFLEEEDCRRTKHPRILVTAYESTVEAEMLEQVVIELVNLTRQMQSRNATKQMWALLPQVCSYIDEYKPVRPQAAPASDRQPVFIKPILYHLLPQLFHAPASDRQPVFIEPQLEGRPLVVKSTSA